MFDFIVRLIMSLALISMGLNLFLGPRNYKAFAGNLKAHFLSVCLSASPTGQFAHWEFC
jgi:hypothetical protein